MGNFEFFDVTLMGDVTVIKLRDEQDESYRKTVSVHPEIMDETQEVWRSFSSELREFLEDHRPKKGGARFRLCVPTPGTTCDFLGDEWCLRFGLSPE